MAETITFDDNVGECFDGKGQWTENGQRLDDDVESFDRPNEA